MLSVALCSCNGAKYIENQIRSILHQTRLVDEIVICDDGSTDNTVEIAEHIRQQSNTEIRIYKNEIRLGVKANFQKAVKLCRGDIVFLSDQDDIWLPNKVKSIFDWFEKNPQKSVLFTNADLIDEKGHNITIDGERCKLWDYYFSENDRKMFEHGLDLECMMKPHATGASMAMRKSFLENHPFPNQTNEQAYHDLIICINAVEYGLLGYINEPLFQYRIHKKQEIGIFGRKRNNDIGDWRCPYYPDDYIADLVRDNNNIKRVRFLSWRIWTKHRVYGPLVVLFSYQMYHKYYRTVCLAIMSYDIKASLCHTGHRIATRIRSCFMPQTHRQ